MAVQTLFAVLRSKAADLLSLLFVLVILLVCASTLMFHLEHDAQPNAFSSIPATMWWGIVTLTTIGYGDMAPVTAAGRALGGVVAVLGIGMFALPAGLLGAAFVDELGKLRAARGGNHDGHAGYTDGAHCPHCGKALGR
jgi:voltage-gated potassium channel